MKNLIAVLTVLAFVGISFAARKAVYDLETGEIVEVGYGDASRFDEETYGIIETEERIDDRRKKVVVDGQIVDRPSNEVRDLDNDNIYDQIIQMKKERAILSIVLESESVVAIGNRISSQIAGIDASITELEGRIR